MTDLARLFAQVYHEKNGVLEAFPNGPDEFDGFIDKVTASSASKTWVRLKNSNDLWMAPKVALLLSDIAFLYGTAGTPKVRMTLIQKVDKPQRFEVPIELYKELKSKIVHPGLLYMQDSMLRTWMNEAMPLIETGQIIYLPERIVLYTTNEDQSKPEWTFQSLETNTKWAFLTPQAGRGSDSNLLLTTNELPAGINDLIDILGIDLPVIREMPLAEYKKLIEDERDSVIILRRAFRNALKEAGMQVGSAAGPEKARAQLLSIKHDIIDPALAELTLKFNTVLNHKKYSALGVTISTVALSINACLFTSPATLVALAGGLGLMKALDEYADYTKQMDSLKQSPWHFLWKLKQPL